MIIILKKSSVQVPGTAVAVGMEHWKAQHSLQGRGRNWSGCPATLKNPEKEVSH